MSNELERIKAAVNEITAGLDQNARITVLDELAWWAAEEAGQLEFDSPDMSSQDDE